jgi:hypothetical protein
MILAAHNAYLILYVVQVEELVQEQQEHKELQE